MDYTDEETLEIKKSAQIILDMINDCHGGSSYLIVNGITIRGDIGYAMEFCETVLEEL